MRILTGDDKKIWILAGAALGALVLFGVMPWKAEAPPRPASIDPVRHDAGTGPMPTASGIPPAPGLAADVPSTAIATSRPPASSQVRANLAEWSRYPSGLMGAADQALRRQDGPGAYDLVRILEACARLPEKLERTRQQVSDMQARRALEPADRSWTEQLLTAMQQDQAHCQALTGDVKVLRRQLLEVAVRAGVEGSGMDLLTDGVEEPWVMRQVLREAESGDGFGLRKLAKGDIPQATRLQRDAARDALVRGARDPALNGDPVDGLQMHLDAVERRIAMEESRADPTNATKAATADRAYRGEGAPLLQPTTDPQVRALADQYLAAVKRRRGRPGN